MSLAPETRFGLYEILGPLGAGGMGEVYRARDTKLGRDVALKVLPDAFARDPDRLARFQREAQVLASLNHPNIAQIYGLEDSSSRHALVMELVDGPTLGELIQANGPGPLALDQSLAIARQIADALEAAHEQGIVHRDLKPANIKIKTDGTAKVLDFGLAKALEPLSASSGGGAADLQDSPTMMSPAVTQGGVILGTAAYMSPEQARGRSVDKRADIWAFGCVLYEMLTGRTACGGISVADTLSAIVRDEPEWSRLPKTAGPRIRALLRRCLQKDPRQRLRDIGDGRLALDEAIASGDPADTKPAVTAHEALTWAFSIPLPAGHWLPLDESPVLALSRDARVLVFVAASRERRQLFRRDLARLSVAPIAGTEGASGPFLSPDARWVGFFSDGWLKRISVDGGAATSLCEVSSLPRGGSWAPDGRIVFSPVPDGPLMHVPDTGGVPQALTRLDADRLERSHRWPEVLPDGQSVIFTIGSTLNTQDYDGCDIALASLDTGQSHTIFHGGRMARAVASGDVLVQRRSTLLRAPLDRAASAARTTASTLMEGVAGDASSGSGYFATAGQVLAYAPVAAVAERLSLFVVDRTGQATLLPAPPKGYRYPRVSSDGRYIACHVADDRELDARGTRGDIWVLDLESRRLSRLTIGGASSYPCWSPDGRRVAFFRAGSPSGVFERVAAGGRVDTPIWAAPAGVKLPEAWHPDGTSLAVQSVDRPVGL
ncbi:MAG: protein kinase, partial [Vicinamibacterales bacterium]